MTYETVVIIPHHNGIPLLHECLSSLKRQTYAGAKVIVVDDASTDGSVSYLTKHFPEVDIVSSNINQGFAKTVNKGIRYALQSYHPTFIALLNNDTKADTQWLEILARRAKENQDIAAVTSHMFFYDHPEIINSEGGTLDWNGDGYDINFGISKEHGKQKSGPVLSACFGACLIRSSVFSRVGFLDERFGSYFEDLDWSWRAVIFGYSILFEKDAIIYHKHSASYRHMPYKKLYLCKRNALRAALKNYENKNLPEQIRHIMLGYWFSIVGYFEEGKHGLSFLKRMTLISIPFLALFWNMLHLPDTLKERAFIQKNRKRGDEIVFSLAAQDLTPVRAWIESIKKRLYSVPKFFLSRIHTAKTYLFRGEKILGTGILKKKSVKPSPFGVTVLGFLDSESGVGEAARTLVRSIRETGIPYAVINSDRAPHRRNEREFSKRFTDKNPYPITIVSINGDMFEEETNRLRKEVSQNRYVIAYWGWELSNLPESWVPLLKQVNEIWAISSFVKDAIRARHKTIPISVIPHAIRIPKHPYGRDRFNLPPDTFLFLFMFDFYSVFERKNPLGVIRAFKEAFPNDPSVGLLIKCSNHEIDKENFEKLKSAVEQDSRIRLLTRYYERDEIASLMNVCDAYVSLHRSEGFGLTLAEAMILRKPVIATDYSGNTDFMNEKNSFPVPYTLIPLTRDYGPYKKGNVWANPNIREAAKRMRLLASEKEIALKKAMEGQRYVISNLNSGVVGKKIEERLEEIKTHLIYSSLK